jgi:hypothetical protein
MKRLVGLVALSAALLLARTAAAEVELCTSTGFASTRGATVCNGASHPITVTATVRTYAHLAVAEVFGAMATSLDVAMGDVDALCIATPAPGITCTRDVGLGAATWYGDVRFRVKLAGVGMTRAKLTGLRPSTGSIPAGRLVDGAAGAVPARPYPVSPASATDLRGSIATGETLVTRSLGLTVKGSDPPGAWSGPAVYSVVVE